MNRDCEGIGRAMLCCLALWTWSTGPAHAAQVQPVLPDWSGWWSTTTRINDEIAQTPPPMRAEDLARYQQSRRDDSNSDPGRFCRPPQFTGFIGGFSEAVEFLFTPGRVTITNEAGLIRRIYTDGRSLPASPEFSNTGTSVGRWEGQTLVVETVGIEPAARYPLHTTHGAMPIGRNVRIVERISLDGAARLRIEVVTTAPDLLLAPDRRTRIYTRIPGKTMASEFNVCVENDRSIDPATGRQRFDMTPPPNLAPPPPR